MDPRWIARELLRWFAANARDLPWRRTSDPYAIWISEIMLQQTQVKTVIPYWERWMRELPTLETLADADESRVLKLWEGLGYYRRARNLIEAARRIVDRHGGAFPRRHEDVLALPGIGPYTAGAICSIAFDQPTPILDGNVARVLCRLGAIRGAPDRRGVINRLWREATKLVEAAHATGRPQACSHVNQALMELGATICTPNVPACGKCPLNGRCAARKSGSPESYPAPKRRPPTAQRWFVVLVVSHRGRWCVRQRPEGSVNARFWEFPNVETEAGDADPVAAIGRMTNLSAPKLAKLEPLGDVKHSITRWRITQRAFRLDVRSLTPELRRLGEWRRFEELEALAFTTAHRRILRMIEATPALLRGAGRRL